MQCSRYNFFGSFNPNRSLGFIADWPHRWRRRSGLRRDSDVEKMPKEMLIWHKQTLKSEKGYKSRSNDRFGFNDSILVLE